MSIKRLTAVIVVKQIEPVLPFWRDAGFDLTMEVPHGDALGFVMLQSGDVEVMFQSLASVQDDAVSAASKPSCVEAALFIEVSSLDEIIAKMAAYPIHLARRQTFYGSDEIGYRDPSGQFVTFAQFATEGA